MRERNTRHGTFVIERICPAGTGPRLVFAEQAVLLDGADTSADREHGTGLPLESPGAELAPEAATV